MTKNKVAARACCALLNVCLLAGSCSVRAEEQMADFAPVTQEGRYEMNGNLLLPGFTYEPDSSHEVDGRQGIAWSEDAYYVSGSTTLTKYGKDWKPVMEAQDPLGGFEAEVNHIGDIDVYNGEIYAGVEYFMDGAADNIQIAVYDAETMELVRTYPIAEESGQTEVSGIAVDSDNKCIWLCSWAEGESGRYLYNYDLESGEYIGKIHLQAPPQWIQGIAYYDGWLYITADDGTADFGEPDHIYRCQVNPDRSYAPVILERSLDDVTLQGEIEGISVDRTAKQMLISYNRGARIVLGMPKGFYSGYDQEIHEVFTYDMERISRPMDYTLADSWFAKPETPTHDADVFMIMPTVNMHGLIPDNEDISNMRTALRFEKTFNMEKGIVSDFADVYAPYYQQATLGCYMDDAGNLIGGTTDDSKQTVYNDIAYEDVKNAWDYYWNNLNQGRPVVLFGYSQGAYMVLRLLSDVGQDEAFSEKLVAAYAIGASVDEAFIADHPYLKMAEGETDTGVIVSYNAIDERAEKPAEKELSINPLNWKTDGTPAEKEENLGFVSVNTYGEIVEEIPEYCGAYLDNSGKLIITDADNLDELYGADNGFFPQGDYHMYNLAFFYRNLQENAEARIEAFS